MTLAQSLRRIDQATKHIRHVRPRAPNKPSFEVAFFFRVQALQMGIRWPDDAVAQKRLRFELRARNVGRAMLVQLGGRSEAYLKAPTDAGRAARNAAERLERGRLR